MLQKQAAVINFAQGLDTKTDINQLSFGKFTVLSNSVFDTLGRLTKRNGFGALVTTIGSSASYLTTFKDNLISVGDTVNAYNESTGLWNNTGNFQSVQLDVLSIIKNMNNQTYVDSAISPNGLLCVVYNEPRLFVDVLKYVVVDRITGQNIVPPTLFPTSLGTVSFSPRVFSYRDSFLMFFNTHQDNGNINFNLSYTSINSLAPTTLGTTANFSTVYKASGSSSFDGVVASNTLFLAWNSNASANDGVRAGSLQGYGMPFAKNEATIASSAAVIMSTAADQTGPVIYASFYAGSASGDGGVYNVPFDQNLSVIHAATRVNPPFQVSNIASIQNRRDDGQRFVTIFYENKRGYLYSPTSPNPFITSFAVTPQGSLTAQTTVVRSVGLASKAFIMNSQSYFMSTYGSTVQNTFFLMNSGGGVVAKLAYGNGGGLLGFGLPSVSIIGSSASVGYLIKDFVLPVNKGVAAAQAGQPGGIYTQTGINQANFNYSTNKLVTSEIGTDLHLNGGFLWMYDGFKPVEHNAFLYPDTARVVSSASDAGAIGIPASTYFYQFTYEWTDNQGNIFRSAPSVPLSFTVATTTIFTGVMEVPTPRLSYKFTADFNTGLITTTNPMRLVTYRWSTVQPIFYQLQSTVLDFQAMALEFLPFTDTAPDSSIIGNNIIYTNGGVVENIQAPAATAMTLFDDRLWLIAAENQNQLWYSKQVIDGVPVETSDLFTLFVAPTIASQASTGVMKAIAPMDDKLVIFKAGSLYYINGSGPDNTGANSQYSQPIFISSAVGCSNPKSILLVPNGLIFQSEFKGIWLLGRDLSVQYIGKDVEAYNSSVVLSAVAIPNSNHVRFNLNTGQVLMYDYFVGQWGTFNGVPAVSSTIYKNLHTYLDSTGRYFQETPGRYFDGSTAVVTSWTTGFVNLANLESYKRLYRGYLLGTYFTSHSFTLGVGYDYNPAITQTITVNPTNTSSSSVEQWQLNFSRQQCQSFQLTFNEIYNTAAGSQGAGLSVSGFNIIAGVSKAWPQNVSQKNRKG